MMKFLLVFFFSLSGLIVQDTDLLPWKPSKRLTWDDFKGLPPDHTRNAASTSSGININFNYSNNSFNYSIACHFNRKKSWGRVKNAHVLSHEQGHFDITELHARKLNKRLKDYKFKYPSISKDVNAIYQQVVNELQVMQNEYDNETDYSRNFYQQKTWQGQIENDLALWGPYAGYAETK